MTRDINLEALRFHSNFPSGKIGISVTKDVSSNLDLAYSPGVAAPCIEINRDPSSASVYTNLSNSIAIISNGTAVLGLGKIGALASKPVMEGKSALFKTMAGIDCIDIEIEERDPSKLAEIIESISISFGGINLEDIAAPECFELERILRERLSIPVFHDDQHGTAIVVTAAVLNALELTNKKAQEVKLVCLGAGAAGIACLNLLMEIGIRRENITLFDSNGVICKSRNNCNKYKLDFAVDNELSIPDALNGADIFLGTSVGNAIKPEWIVNMNRDPLILALANPVPEIYPDIAKSARSDAIVCSGRSDFPNQVNNVLCFPYLFRVALDNKLAIDENMKLATANAIANLAKTYRSYGREHIVPSSKDPALKYIMPSLILKEMNIMADLQRYSRDAVARRFLPHSQPIFEIAEAYLGFDSEMNEVTRIHDSWGFTKSPVTIMHKLNEIPKDGLFVVSHGQSYILIYSDNKAALLDKLSDIIPVAFMVRGSVDNEIFGNVIGCIKDYEVAPKFFYNQHAPAEELALFSLMCAGITNGSS